MRYQVDWLPTAEQALADIWNHASDQAAVTAAADAIDAALERNPLTLGESRSGKARIVFAPPLAVVYEVDAANRQVTVFGVWRYPP
jgi:plasmid stabilization system protein ParE